MSDNCKHDTRKSSKLRVKHLKNIRLHFDSGDENEDQISSHRLDMDIKRILPKEMINIPKKAKHYFHGEKEKYKDSKKVINACSLKPREENTENAEEKPNPRCSIHKTNIKVMGNKYYLRKRIKNHIIHFNEEQSQLISDKKMINDNKTIPKVTRSTSKKILKNDSSFNFQKQKKEECKRLKKSREIQRDKREISIINEKASENTKAKNRERARKLREKRKQDTSFDWEKHKKDERERIRKFRKLQKEQRVCSNEKLLSENSVKEESSKKRSLEEIETKNRERNRKFREKRRKDPTFDWEKYKKDERERTKKYRLLQRKKRESNEKLLSEYRMKEKLRKRKHREKIKKKIM